MAEELTLEQLLGNGRAVDLDQGLVLSRAEVVKRSSNQLLPGPGLTGDDDIDVGRGDRFDGFEQILDGRRLAEDVAEIVFGFDLFLQVQILLFEPRLQRRNLFMGERVLDGERDLLSHLCQEVGITLRVPIGRSAPDIQGSERLPLPHERDGDVGSDPLLEQAILQANTVLRL